jgi:ABC-type multidrug transport system fused ATPase/permease subunit
MSRVVKFDKVMVLENGKMVQSDSPLKLISEDGVFR